MRGFGIAGVPLLATVRKATQSRLGGLQDGAEVGGACGTCGADFTIENLWGQAMNGMSGRIVSALSAARVLE